MIPTTPGSTSLIGLGDGAGIPGVATGGGAREPAWIGPARRHEERVAAAGRGFYSADWAMHPSGDERAPMTLGVERERKRPPRQGGLPLFVQFAERAFRAYEASAPQEGARAGQAGTMFALWRKRLSGSQVRLISRSLANRSGPNAAATRAAV